ncbi:MAG: neutral/alkaline non-lysosomal ceramidase N-terminal domain-containing protein [Acidobacteriota bacterium]
MRSTKNLFRQFCCGAPGPPGRRCRYLPGVLPSDAARCSMLKAIVVSTAVLRNALIRGIAVTVLLGILGDCSTLTAAVPEPWRAGVATVSITPERPIWQAGYGARVRPSEGTSQELYAKALVLEDPAGHRVVLVTTDLLGFPAVLSDGVAARVRSEYHIARKDLLLSASHTHCGPVVARMLAVAYDDMNGDHWREVDRYTKELEDRIVAVVGRAIRNLAPARLSFGRTSAGFAANRRQAGGPIDPDVPVLRVDGEKGVLRAVVFGYACHAVTLDGDFYQFHGDYPGVAQEWLEKRHPGALALFLAGCGGDINPKPRGSLAITQQHGEALAQAVNKTLSSSMQRLHGVLRSAWEEFPVRFAPPPTREDLNRRVSDQDKYVRSHARKMLAVLDRNGRLPPEYPYPLQVWQVGSDLTWVAMAGEVVVDYVLRLQKELAGRQLWVSAYCNDVFGYIPSLRVLGEGGYEGGGAMLYYVQPGPFDSSIEETIVRKVHELVKQTDAR